MSQLIQPILDGFKSLLQNIQFGADDQLRDIGQQWTGNLVNPPGAWVMPGKTQFPDRGEGTVRSQVHGITIRIGLTGSDPEELSARALRYVQAVDAAIEAMPNTSWGDTLRVLYVFVAEHDYGVMWRSGNVVAMWPDIHLEVEVEELQ